LTLSTIFINVSARIFIHFPILQIARQILSVLKHSLIKSLDITNYYTDANKHFQNIVKNLYKLIYFIKSV